MKSRPKPRRKPPGQDRPPPEVPEVTVATARAEPDPADPIPEHIRRMLEAAYT